MIPSLHLAQIVVRIAVDVEIIGVDADMARLLRADEAEDLLAGADRHALHADDVGPVELAATGFGGEQADFDPVGKRRLLLRALASRIEFAGFDRNGDVPLTFRS